MKALALLLLCTPVLAQTPVTITGTATATPTSVVISIPSQNITVAVPQPTCALPQPATTSQTIACPAGSTGSWQQTTNYAAAPYPACWTPVLSPASAPPGSCVTNTPPPTGISWVYTNGIFYWPGDWSWSATINYTDTSGVPPDGAYDIKVVTSAGGTGGWQPYINSNCQQNVSLCFVTTPYKYLIFSLKSTIASPHWAAHFESAGDTPDGSVDPISPYMVTAGCQVIGAWCQYKIPLSAFALSDTTILKFSIQDQVGGTTFYVADVGFSP